MAAIDDLSPLPDKLVLPIWMAQALNAPDVSVRLRALDKWVTLGADASIDPLVVALDDDNDDVRKKAMELIEQHWAVEPQATPEAEQRRGTGTALP
jgi:HEAT repeat protein